jgi:Ca2+-binding EF-hand superfamily protein
VRGAGNGTIEINELRLAMKSLGAADGEAERVMKAAGASNKRASSNGVITFDDFCAVVGPVYEHSHVALRRAFNVFDSDGNGSIDRAEGAPYPPSTLVVSI